MPWSSKHIDWLEDTKKTIQTKDGLDVKILEFVPDQKNSSIMSSWAKHFRNHYCFDTEIDFFKNGTGCSKSEFLNLYKFPTTKRGFGPGIRAGDFGEILVADYLEFMLNHWVPRTRYGTKTIRDESTKGSDLIGFKFFDENETSKDILTMIEVKTQFSGSTPKQRLQDAIDDSSKDELRKAESLNAMKQRLYDKNKIEEAKKIARFQNPTDKPYKERFGAAALFSTKVFDTSSISKTDASNHPHKNQLFLLTIYSKDFMFLVNKLYEVAANEA